MSGTHINRHGERFTEIPGSQIVEGSIITLDDEGGEWGEVVEIDDSVDWVLTIEILFEDDRYETHTIDSREWVVEKH